MRPESPIIDDILEYRQVSKLRGTYTTPLIDAADGESRIHTDFKQTLTATGRLSSADPNLQNIPIKTKMGRELRRFFVAEEGYTLVDADYSQIELRVLAHLCEDEGLIEAFEKGIDIHTHTAMSIFGVPEILVTPDMRRLAKVVNFGVNYGISEYGLARDLKIPVYEAREYIDNYYTAHPKIKKYMQDSIETARETGRVVTLLGRTRKMAEISSSNYMVRQSAERASQNMPMQGGAADIIKLAMLKIEKRLESEGYKARLIMQVHDELIIDSPQSEADKVREIVVTEMKNAYKMLIPLEVDSTISYRWSEGH
jgi:DNA polymerase-1